MINVIIMMIIILMITAIMIIIMIIINMIINIIIVIRLLHRGVAYSLRRNSARPCPLLHPVAPCPPPAGALLPNPCSPHS